MKSAELLIQWVDEPPPPDRRGRPKDSAMRDALSGLTVGGPAIEVNRAPAAIEHHVYRYRVQNGRELGFKVRASRPGWSKIWRVK